MKKILILIIFITNILADDIIKPIIYISNDISKDVLNERVKNSHISVFLPSIPYTYISKLINGTLFRLADNKLGYEKMLASWYEKINELTYDVSLKKGIRFQDGSSFNAGSVVENIKAFIKRPFTYTDIHNRLKSVEKIDKYKVRFHLKKPYGMFIRDLARINLYSHKYLTKFSFHGRETGDNTKSAGAYGLGAYILVDGYATGRAQTPIVKLKANPYYYEKGLPYIENITIYTQLSANEAFKMAMDGKLDIAPIAYDKKSEIVHSKYAKLVTIPSTNNISIYQNLLKKDGILKNQKVRVALNKAIEQKKLLHFVYKNEGKTAPTTASVHYEMVSNAIGDMSYHGKNLSKTEQEKIKKILNGLSLKVITQDRFMFLWKGIEYQLKKYGVKLIFHTTTNEKDVYNALLENRKNPKDWDLLTWGNDDWYGKHPWTVFFSYRTSSDWSAIDNDEILQEYIQNLFASEEGSSEFKASIKNIIKRVYEKAYMLFVPSVNAVYAVNKEVDFTPYSLATMPLWKSKITKYHRSVFKSNYPNSRQNPMYPKRLP